MSKTSFPKTRSNNPSLSKVKKKAVSASWTRLIWTVATHRRDKTRINMIKIANKHSRDMNLYHFPWMATLPKNLALRNSLKTKIKNKSPIIIIVFSWEKLLIKSTTPAANRIGNIKPRCFWRNSGKPSTGVFPVQIYRESLVQKWRRQKKTNIHQKARADRIKSDLVRKKWRLSLK